MNTLEISISTYGSRVNAAINLATLLSPYCPVMIVHQSDVVFPEQKILVNHCLKECKNIRYFHRKDKGVAKSRNFSINNSISEYLWLLDDDVTVNISLFLEFYNNLSSGVLSGEVITFGVLDEYGRPRRKFDNRPKMHNMLSILSIGTIEMVVQVKAVIKSEATFPSYMGAGTELPISDEPVFLSRCIKKELSVRYYPYFFVSHPRESSGLNVFDEANCKARGVAFREIYGKFLGLLLLIIFYIRKIKPPYIDALGVRRSLKNVISGFCEFVKGYHQST